MKTPKKFTKPDKIYSGDNGRLSCVECSGMSMTYTGRDISGKRAITMNAEDNRAWIQYFQKPMAGECGRTSFDLAGNCKTKEERMTSYFLPEPRPRRNLAEKFEKLVKSKKSTDQLGLEL